MSNRPMALTDHHWADAANEVFSVAYRLNMFGIYASSIAAEMVAHQAGQRIAALLDLEKSVSGVVPIVDGELGISARSPCASPQPALIIASAKNLAPEPCLNQLVPPGA
jgi:hypothetical protein